MCSASYQRHLARDQPEEFDREMIMYLSDDRHGVRELRLSTSCGTSGITCGNQHQPKLTEFSVDLREHLRLALNWMRQLLDFHTSLMLMLWNPLPRRQMQQR